MTRIVLVVDDNAINRRLLCSILDRDYDVLEAADGAAALALLEQRHGEISAVLLDLLMPVLDGYEVLSRMGSDERLSQIPVIVTTGTTAAGAEVRALSLGAKDYITKPYDPDIIRHRLRNTIRLRETAAAANAASRDELTGLYSRRAFFAAAEEMISAHEPGYYILACFDVDNFKVVNDQYGTEKGDQVLRALAAIFREGFGPAGGICCRIMADNFAVLYPRSFAETEALADIRRRAARPDPSIMSITFSIGRYIVDDPSLSVSGMYDRASLAEASIKGRYDARVAQYSESMRDRLLREQRIVTEMNAALLGGQFEVWFQPQYNHATGALVGAEALVRWRHPSSGLLDAPGDFIQVFERNGFIYELDKFVWERACMLLRRWLDQGRSPLPVSVNVSRYDVFRDDFYDVITGLVQKYDLPIDLLRLEITETAFSKNNTQIISEVRRLVDRGFLVEIDDFGSGYSSLNTLKDVPAAVLKLDMKFLENTGDTRRGGNVLESVVRMAKWLGMSVIAEGVETLSQADYLKSIGCSYVQGYLYARPMPAEEYEALAEGSGKEHELCALQTAENLDNNAFWDPQSIDTLIFNSYVGGACVFEYSADRVELLRSTDKFAHMLGGESMTVESALQLDLSAHMDGENRAALMAALQHSVDSRDEVLGEYVFTGLPDRPHRTYLRLTVRIIASAGEHHLVYCRGEDITAQRLAEQQLQQAAEHLRAILNDTYGGFCRLRRSRGGRLQVIFANDGFCALLGKSQEAVMRLGGEDALRAVHPDDVGVVVAAFGAMQEGSGQTRLKCRLRHGEAGFVPVLVFARLVREEDGGECLNAYFADGAEQDRLEEQRRELVENLPCGAGIYEVSGGRIRATYLNRRYRSYLRRQIGALDEAPVFEVVHPDDTKKLQEALQGAILRGQIGRCDIRIMDGEGGYIPFHVVGNVMGRSGEKISIYVTYTPIAPEELLFTEMLPVALEAMMASSTSLSFVKDSSLRYICCSRRFAKMVGLQSEKDVAGKTDHDFFDKALADKYVADDRQLLSSGQSLIDSVELIPSDDGRTHYSSTSKFLLHDSHGNVIGLYGVGQDITQAREADSQLKLLNDSIPCGLATYECDGADIRITYFNDGFCKLLGFSREEYLQYGRFSAADAVFAEDLPELMRMSAALTPEGAPVKCQYRIHVRGGGYKWISHQGAFADRKGSRVIVNAALFDVTAQQEATERLRMSEEEHRLAMKLSGNIICRYTLAGRTLSLSAEAAAAFGMEESTPDVPEEPIRRGLLSPDTMAAYREFFGGILRGEKSGTGLFRQKYGDSWRWLEAHYAVIFSDTGRPISAVISLTDVTSRLEKEAIFKKWQQSLLDKDPDSYTLLRCNLSRGTGFDSVEGALLHMEAGDEKLPFRERTRKYAERSVYKEDRSRYLELLSPDALLAGYYREKRSDVFEYRELLPDGDVRWLRLTVELVEYPNSTDVEAYLMHEDIDGSKRAQLLTIQRAETDPLTGVLNRATFTAQAEQLMGGAQAGAQHALLILDIDGFKQVNDAFGHAAGDQVIIEVANLLRSVLRRGDLLGRLGGDEFVIFLNDIPGDTVAGGKARQICAMARRAVSVEVQVSVSIGIAMTARDGLDFRTLYEKADAALYHAKAAGKDGFSFYREEMRGEQRSRSTDAAEAEPKPSRKKHRMLIVEDNRLERELLTDLFRDEYLIEKAADGQAALLRLRHYGSAISVVLLDLYMPVMDGFEVLRQMQESPKLRSIPVVVVSGSEDPRTGLQAIRGGAADYVVKPVDTELLHIRVSSAVSKAENERLRARNSFLELQSEEARRYMTALEEQGVAVVEYDWVRDSFIYDPVIAKYITGSFDSRSLWRILLSDMAAEVKTVRAMQEFVHAIAVDGKRTDGSMTVRLKTPAHVWHSFRLGVRKLKNEYQLTDKLILTFQDLDAGPVSPDTAGE